MSCVNCGRTDAIELCPECEAGEIQKAGPYELVNGARIHRLANIVGDITIGEGSRIDAFVTITGDVEIGRYTHIGTMVCVFGGGGVKIGDYVGISPGVKIFSGTEDASGEWVTNPTVPERLRNPAVSFIKIADHALVGANTVLLPGAHLPEGACVGAVSLVKHLLSPWSIWAGCPARRIRDRSQGVKRLINDPANWKT